MKKRTLPHIALAFAWTLVVLTFMLSACGESSNESKSKELTKYEKGIEWFNKEKYVNAKWSFQKVEKTDSNYADAQEKIKICNDYIKKRDEKIKEKDDAKKRYERILRSTYLYKNESELFRRGFIESSKGYEEAPDGSEQIATYYKKDENGYTVTVKLQYSYSLEHHYVDVHIK